MRILFIQTSRVQKEAVTTALIASATDDVSQSELLIVEHEIKKSTQVKKPTSPMSQKRLKQRLEYMLGIHGTKAAFECFNKIYPKYTFLRTSINNWKFKIKKDQEGKTIFKWKGRPNLLSDDLMAKVKTIMIRTCTAGTAVRRNYYKLSYCNQLWKWSGEVK